MALFHDWSKWGRLRTRYEEPRPRRMLALDGGGIRGLISLQVLRSLEAQLRAQFSEGLGFRLCQFFDYIAGTSTGAILAAGLSMGMAVKELEAFYVQFAQEVFQRRPWYELWRSLYTKGSLETKMRDVFGADTNLEPEHLQNLLLVVTRNTTTDSAWPISSNPSAKYNDTDRKDCNLRFPLWKIVRASTAAPVYFPPEVIPWDPTNPVNQFVFVDGGTTAFNDPAFIQYRMATEPYYRLGWERGEHQMLIVSIGTGLSPILGATAEELGQNVLSDVKTTLKSLMSQALFDQDLACRTVGRCTFGPELDREVLDLVPRQDPFDPKQSEPIPLTEDLGRAFLYARYDALVTGPGLTDLGLSHIDPAKVAPMDCVNAIDELRAIGSKLGERVALEHFGKFAEPDKLPLSPLL